MTITLTVSERRTGRVLMIRKSPDLEVPVRDTMPILQALREVGYVEIHKQGHPVIPYSELHVVEWVETLVNFESCE